MADSGSLPKLRGQAPSFCMRRQHSSCKDQVGIRQGRHWRRAFPSLQNQGSNADARRIESGRAPLNRVQPACKFGRMAVREIPLAAADVACAAAYRVTTHTDQAARLARMLPETGEWKKKDRLLRFEPTPPHFTPCKVASSSPPSIRFNGSRA